MSIPLRWASPDGICHVELSQVALGRMIELADETHPLENGGSLFGRYSDDQRHAFVDGVAPVAGDSSRGRYDFRRGTDGLAAFFRRLFKKTQGKSHYVGEFHSHPEGLPLPSSADDAAQFAIAADEACSCVAPILLIVGGAPGARSLGAFVHTRSGKRFVLEPR